MRGDAKDLRGAPASFKRFIGNTALWVVVDGHWKEAQGTQETWDCAVLKQYAVPSDVAGTTCYDYAAQQEHEYHQK